MRNHRLSQADVLDALRRAILIAQATVSPEGPEAAELANLLKLATAAQADAEADEATSRLVDQILTRGRRVVGHG